MSSSPGTPLQPTPPDPEDTATLEYDRELTATGRRPAFAFILFTLLLDILGIGLIIPVLPRLVTQLSGGTESTSAWKYGVFVAVYATMQFFCAPLLGALSDQFGRRPVLLISIFGTACDYVLMTFAPNLALLFLGRVLNGITAANITTANAYVADVTKPEDRAKRFGLTGAVFGIGFVLGPSIGGLLAEPMHFPSWIPLQGAHDFAAAHLDHLRWPFAFAAFLALANFMYGLVVLPESHLMKNRRPFTWSKANPAGSLVALRRFRGVVPLAAVLSTLNLAQFSLHSTWVLYTAYRFHWGPRDVGLSLGFVGVLAVFVQGFLTGKVVKKIGEHATLYLGLVFAALAYTGYGMATQGWMMYAVMVVGAFGGMLGPAAQALITQEVGPTNQGLAQGALSSLSALTAIIAPLVATWLFSHFTGSHAFAELPGVSFLLGGFLVAVGFLIAILFVRKHAPAAVEVTVAG